MSAYTPIERVLDKDLCEVYDSQGVQGVFQKFGASGLYRLFDEWRTGHYTVIAKRGPAEVRVQATHESYSQRGIRDLCVGVSLSNSLGGRGGMLYDDKDVQRFADALRNARQGSIVDETFVGRIEVSSADAHLRRNPKGISLVIGARGDYISISLQEDEVCEVEQHLPRALAEVELYSTLKEHAEFLLEKK